MVIVLFLPSVAVLFMSFYRLHSHVRFSFDWAYRVLSLFFFLLLLVSMFPPSLIAVSVAFIVVDFTANNDITLEQAWSYKLHRITFDQ